MFVTYRLEGEATNHRKQESTYSQRIEVDYRHRSAFPGLLILCVYIILVENNFALRVTKTWRKGHTHVQQPGNKKCCGRLLIDLHCTINSLGIFHVDQSHRKGMAKIASRIQADVQDSRLWNFGWPMSKPVLLHIFYHSFSCLFFNFTTEHNAGIVSLSLLLSV